MNELTPTTKFKPITPSTGLGPEVAALNQMLQLLNDPSLRDETTPAGTKVLTPQIDPAEVSPFVPGYTPDPAVGSQISQPVASPSPAPLAPMPSDVVLRGKIFFTGRLKVGKDYVAKSVGAELHGFADPIYWLASHFFGVEVTPDSNKDLPGMREFLQTIGQWGRGEITKQYPISPARGLFLHYIWDIAKQVDADKLGVEWDKFGLTPDLWLDACLKRAESSVAPLVAITNARFENEIKRLRAEGFSHWHILASPQTYGKRLVSSGIDPKSPALSDASEAVARSLDADVMRKLAGGGAGGRLRVIWNDEQVPSPSPRLHSLQSFRNTLAAQSVAPESTAVITGE